jgi:hypothetical protein
MARLSRKSRGRKPPRKDKLDKLLAQLPADSLDRQILTEFSSKTGELFANFEAEFALAGREHDPRKAIEMAISNFEVTCEAALGCVHNLETARDLERDLDAAVEGIRDWFRQWVRIAAAGSAKAKELGPELTRQLLKISSKAKARAWHSLRVVSDAHIPATPVPAPEAPPPPEPVTAPEPQQAGADLTVAPADAIAESSDVAARRKAREAGVMPILTDKVWSANQWAIEASVDFHTVDNYLKGITKKLQRAKRELLAAALGITPKALPL